jgi:hypothetical protein
LYTIKWTGLQPKEDGWSPPSDTTVLRLSESYLAVGDGKWGSAYHRDLQMVRKDRHPIQQLLDENSSLLVGGRLPNLVDIEIPESCSDTLEMFIQFGSCGHFLGLRCRLGSCSPNEQGEALLFLMEEIHRDLLLVAHFEEHPTMLRQFLHAVSRSLLGAPGRPGGRFPAAPGKLPANRLLEVSIGAD